MGAVSPAITTRANEGSSNGIVANCVGTMSIKILHKKNRLHPIIEGHPWGASRRDPMDQVWDLVAGTFIAVSVFTGVAFIIVSAVHL
jgi:hypothetical protein